MSNDVNDMPIDERIRMWRQHARLHARAALDAAHDPGATFEQIVAASSMAVLYFTAAADAERFGDLPELE
jgi:hypothetical protein